MLIPRILIALKRERVFFCSKLNDANWNFEIPEISQDFKNVVIRDIMDENAEWIVEKNFIENNGNLLFENKLPNYKGKTIELNLEKLQNQNPNKINRVAKLKKINFESNKQFFGVDGCSPTFAAKAYCKFQNKLADAAFGNRSTFCGTDGKHWCAASQDVPLCKILEDIPFKEDSTFCGIEGKNRTLTTVAPKFKAKIIDEGIRYRSLTTLEVFRLMTFDDLDFEKLKNKVSDNQICKQLGNSIVVNVLYEIYKKMFQQD